MINPKLILFDLGGVLVDCDNSFATASRDLGIPIETIGKVFDKYEAEITLGKITPQQLYWNLLAEQKMTANREYDFIASWVNDYRAIKVTCDLLPQIASQYKIALLSNTYHGIVELVMARKVIPQIKFDYTFLSCNVGMQKPDKAFYLYVEELTGLSGAEILYIDDRADFLIIPQKLSWGSTRFDRLDPKNSIEKLTSLLS